MRWLAAKTREMAEYKWGYIELNGTLDHLKDSIEAVVEENGGSVSRKVKQGRCIGMQFPVRIQ